MVTIRPFHADDLDHLYGISLATGAAGGDASHLYADPKLMGHIYSAPYARLDPQLALVVEDEEGVAGVAVGTADTTAWEERLEREWWPSLRAEYGMPHKANDPARTPDQQRIVAIYTPARTPRSVALNFPAHLHLNLLPRLHRRGVGRELFNRWRAAAGEAGAKAMHVGINRANVGALGFWGKMGFVGLTVDGLQGRTIWMGLA
jgi:GNAT superfamily N-acetyltransferase